jgi:hypothetical protein
MEARAKYLLAIERYGRDYFRQKLREWRTRNPDAWRSASTSEQRNKAFKKYRDRNREKRRLQSLQHYIEHPEIYAANRVKRRTRGKLATPSWANHSVIKGFYDRAADISRVTGICHHVDHIVPLQGRNVCGLHVEYNLQILTASENRTKRNL